MSEQSHNRATHVIIDRAAFAHNLTKVRELVPNSKVMAVIKADGYGHGMEVAADALVDADEFAVNSLDDVYRLRKHGVDKRLNVLSAQLDVEQLNTLAELNVRPVIYDLAQLSDYEKIADDARLCVWLKVDTGMGRLGVLPDEVGVVYQRLSGIKGISSISLMTHLANADNADHPSNENQISSIKQIADQYDFDELSVVNSAGAVNFPSAHADYVRSGIMLYGISPVMGKTAAQLGLKPVMTFKSQLISVKFLPAGSAVGYGSAYSLDVNSRIGVVACGYGDGFPRHAPSGTLVLVNGFYVPLVGRVSMDMLTVDLGELPAEIGDEVILWGEDNPVEDVAESSGTIGYELCCGILPRVERIVI